MLELKNINLDFPDFSLQNISFEVGTHAYHMLLGPSGSGKTLLMNIIAGFIEVDSGKVIYHGEDITRFQPQKRNIAYLFQDLALFPHMNVFDNIAFPLRVKHTSRKEIASRVEKYMDFTETSHLAKRQIEKLSGGEKQRVALARMLITESGLLLLDEPFSALDTGLKLDLKKLLKKIQQLGVSILHITHNYEEAVSLADIVTIIEKGKIIKTATLDDTTVLSSRFEATLRGEKNYFYIREIIPGLDSNTLVVSSHNDGKGKLPVVIQEQLPKNPAAVLIHSHHIFLSLFKLESSARNNFEGIVTTILRAENGYDLELSVMLNGVLSEDVRFWVKITQYSFDSMQIALHTKLWISFKASAVQIV